MEGCILNRRHFLGAIALAATLSFAPPVFAASKKPFDQKTFEAAQAAGQPILIDVSAPWCPVCWVQAPILARLTSEPRMKSLVIFTVDFDSQKELLRKLKVQKQSTLIVFKGAKEVGRSTGDTSPGSIEALLNKSI
jgi:thiol-disulfide isomerase/thioredoxin